MNKKRITTALAAAAALGGGLWFYQRADAREAPAFRYAAVERADVRSTVSATGTLGAVTTVQVGTQVSGQISAIYVDFNDKVTKGQLLARIDPTLAQQSVADAEASLERVQAQLAQAKEEYDRNAQLFRGKIVTATEFNTAQSNYAVAQANAKSARIALDRARQNLSYTSIHAPIDGVVVERNVDVGQTVAASLQAPQLFLIANDLSQMQILASVDESDIGRIRDGQAVSFTVQAYPNQTFSGTVRQVRLQSATQDNVVNYTAVVGVRNPDDKLLPGMTATVKFLTDSAANVLTVPNAALRFQPPASEQSAASPPRPTTGAQVAAGATRARRVAGDSAATKAGTLWTVDGSGKLVAHRVRVGLTDGQRTQVQGQGIDDGTEVVVGTAEGTQAATAPGASSSSPFQPQSGQRRGPGGPPGGF
jgi:HlyD family secretion protein